jgi:hypothetical protein
MHGSQIPMPNVSPGDAWIAFEPKSNTLTVASEADKQVGWPFVVVDRVTGAVLDRRQVNVGNILIHPDASIIYLSSFRRNSKIVAYDLQNRRIIATATPNQRVHRFAFDQRNNEVLLASSSDSSILRYDPVTLDLKGVVPSQIGTRVLAIDSGANILLSASLVTGELSSVELSKRSPIRTYYLGPWLRSIVLAPKLGMAFVSSNGALYRLRYKANQ